MHGNKMQLIYFLVGAYLFSMVFFNWQKLTFGEIAFELGFGMATLLCGVFL